MTLEIRGLILIFSKLLVLIGRRLIMVRGGGEGSPNRRSVVLFRNDRAVPSFEPAALLTVD